MARSPIRGIDPPTDSASGGAPGVVEAKAPVVDVTQNESSKSATAIGDADAAQDTPSASAESAPEAQADQAPVDGAVETEPTQEAVKVPLKKPLGLSLRKPPAEVKPPPSNKMQIDGAIELTLSAANTAVDAAQEIQRLRAELEMVSAASQRSRRLLMGATLLIAVSMTAALTGALIFYQRSFADFQALAKINREVLMTFAGEVKGLTATSRTIEETVKVSAQALAAAGSQTEEIRKAIQGFTAAQKSLEAKIAPASAYEKQFSGLKQPLDDLTTMNNAMTSRLVEMERARQAREQAMKPVVEAPKAEAPKTPPKPAPSRDTNRENMVRYP
jgi:hypothetical protein